VRSFSRKVELWKKCVVLVEKVGHFGKKVRHFRKKPNFIEAGQVIVEKSSFEKATKT
jgi:hypothetical protein